MKELLSNAGRFANPAVVVLILAVAVVLLHSMATQSRSNEPHRTAAPQSLTASNASVELAGSQLNAIKIESVGTQFFPVEKEAVGSIGFVDDLNVQVFPPYQGKLIKSFVELDDMVEKGQPLYTIDSPDLIQAESTLISAAGTFEVTSKELARVKDLSQTKGISERELEQATSDQQAAEGTLRAAKDAVRVFGKTETEIDQILISRKIDSSLVVHSPVTGQITAMNAPPGVLVQPGTAPAPFSVADTSRKWMLANVLESDSPLFHVGQLLRASVLAYPGRVFHGEVTKVYAAVDPNTHRVTVRSEILDPNHELRPGMLASFVIQVSEPVQNAAVPVNAVVRESDGTMTAWVTTDHHRFFQRTVKLGLQKTGWYEVLGGLNRGEQIVTDGAVFLSNILEAPPTD